MSTYYICHVPLLKRQQLRVKRVQRFLIGFFDFVGCFVVVVHGLCAFVEMIAFRLHFLLSRLSTTQETKLFILFENKMK